MKKYKVITPTDLKPLPSNEEMRAAIILAELFHSDVEFIRRANTAHTPDVKILKLNIAIEIKTPDGNSRRHTIERQFVNAAKQGEYLVINSTEKTKLTDEFIENEILRQIALERHIRYFKKVWLIKKTGEVVDFNKRK